MARRRNCPMRSQRSTMVSHNPTEENHRASSSSDVFDEIQTRRKVRRQPYVLELKRYSEHFKMDEDHLYSKMQRVETPKKTFTNNDECDGVPQCDAVGLLPSSSSSLAVKSDGTDGTPRKWGSCSTKNALLARLNRERKKQYISSLESRNQDLERRNDEILQRVNDQEKLIAGLEHEVKYLKGLLANSKELSDILTSLKQSTGLPVQTSLRMGDGSDNAGQARTKFSSYFPVLKDVNLGGNFEQGEIPGRNHANEEMSFSFKSDSLENMLFDETEFDFREPMLDYGCESAFSFELETKKNLGELNEIKPDCDTSAAEYDSDIGLCLHVNRKRIFVEVCSLCNSKSQIS